MSDVELDLELDDETYEQLERLANDEGVSVEELCSRIISDYCDEYDQEVS